MSGGTDMTAWVNSPHWTLFLHQEHLLLSGGGDEVYVLDEVPDAAAGRRLFDAWTAGRLAALEHDAELGAAVRQLRRAGALVPARALQPPQRLGLVWLGDASAALADEIRRQTAACAPGLAPVEWIDDPATADRLLMLRTNASWDEVLRRYRELRPRLPHLLLDASNHHTVSVGPYVVPGETACLNCLGNRIAHRWGDTPLPPQPRSAGLHGLIAALAARCADADAAAAYLERSVSLDLHTLASREDRVFRLPECPVCHPAQQEADAGSLPLPWLAS